MIYLYWELRTTGSDSGSIMVCFSGGRNSTVFQINSNLFLIINSEEMINIHFILFVE